jgi:hypothetical protein
VIGSFRQNRAFIGGDVNVRLWSEAANRSRSSDNQSAQLVISRRMPAGLSAAPQHSAYRQPTPSGGSIVVQTAKLFVMFILHGAPSHLKKIGDEGLSRSSTLIFTQENRLWLCQFMNAEGVRESSNPAPATTPFHATTTASAILYGRSRFGACRYKLRERPSGCAPTPSDAGRGAEPARCSAKVARARAQRVGIVFAENAGHAAQSQEGIGDVR